VRLPVQPGTICGWDLHIMTSTNDYIITEFRANAGMVGGHFEGKHLLLLHTISRRTGGERVIPLVYTKAGDNYLVAGSSGGAQTEPEWVANVEATPGVTVETGEGRLAAKASVLRAGPEREWLYDLLAEYWPDLAKYESSTSRQFPMIRLNPTGDPAS
jgi:deazaflavin-dependent oxidoreductase (nitroreductase family)